MKFQVLSVLLLAGRAYAEARAAAFEAFPESPRHKHEKGLWDRANNNPAISPDGSCGVGTYGVYTCRGSAYGSCCGGNGACGNDAASCDVTLGCNSDYGVCDDPNAAPSSSSSAQSTTPTPIPPATSSAARIGAPFPFANGTEGSITTAPGIQVNISSTTITPTFGAGGRSGSALAGNSTTATTNGAGVNGTASTTNPFPNRTTSSSQGGLSGGNRNGTFGATSSTPAISTSSSGGSGGAGSAGGGSNGASPGAGSRTGNQGPTATASNEGSGIPGTSGTSPTGGAPGSGGSGGIGGGPGNGSGNGGAGSGQRLGSATPVSTLSSAPAGQVCVVYASVTTFS